MGDAYGLLVARCGRCRGPIEIHVDTTGDGEIVDIVQPCPNCLAPKQILRHLPPPRAARALIGLKRTNPLAKLALAKARGMLEHGKLSVPRIANMTGLSEDNIRRLRREMEAEAPRFCGCGRHQNHGGRCAWRRHNEGRV